MNKLFRLPIYLLKITIYYFSYLIPKDNNLWLFGAWSGEKYNDNSKYFFEYILKNQKNEKCFWITRNKNIFIELTSLDIPVLYSRSVKSIYFMLRAKVIVMTNGIYDIGYSFLINNNTLKIQLWHGVGNKKIAYNSSYLDAYHKYDTIKKTWLPFLFNYRFDVFISTSELMQERFVSSFRLNELSVPITGYPRNDIFNSGRQKEKKLEKILYAPTFRKQGKSSELLHLPNYNILKLFEEYFQQNNIQFYIKLHFLDEQNMNKIDFKEFKNIHLIESNEFYDIQTEMLDVDMLITDYSSIYFDYLLLDRPIIFSAFDLEEYNANDQGTYESLEKIAAGPICKNWNEIMNEIILYQSNINKFSEKRQNVRNRFHKYQDGNSSQRVYETIKKQISKNYF